jgi:hypothetical protein
MLSAGQQQNVSRESGVPKTTIARLERAPSLDLVKHRPIERLTAFFKKQGIKFVERGPLCPLAKRLVSASRGHYPGCRRAGRQGEELTIILLQRFTAKNRNGSTSCGQRSSSIRRWRYYRQRLYA